MCSKNDPIPNTLEASKYVIIKKKDLCQCSLSAGTWYIQENIVHCEEEASSDLQLYYTVNMAVMIYDFLKEIKEAEVRDISLYAEPVKYDPVEIDLVDIKTDKVIGDTYQRLAFKRVMENRDNRIYANKIDYMMDTNDASDVFSGHNKYQTILFILIFIFVVILIICLFGKYLGLNLHFQKILATVNKITPSIKTLLPVTLPAVTQAAAIVHEDVTLQINNIDIFIYAIQIITVMAIIIAVIWLCIQIWNCINTRNLGRLQEKLTFMNFLYADKTDIYLQFMSNYMTWSVYLGSVYDNPEGIEAVGQFLDDDITLYKGCVFDFLTIQWDNISLSQHDLDLWLPSSLPVSLTSKFFLRKLFDNPKTLFRIIAYNPQNGKVRPITTLYKLQPIEEVVSCDAKPYHFEIAFSKREEQDFNEDNQRREESCVSVSDDDEVPELEFIPDLTPEEKEAEQLKDDQKLDQDIEVAIQLSLDCSAACQKLNIDQPHSTANTETDKVTQHDRTEVTQICYL